MGGEVVWWSSYGSIYKLCNGWSKFESDIRIELLLEGLFLIMLKIGVVVFWAVDRVGVGTSEDVVGLHSGDEASVAGKRFWFFHVLFAVTFFDIWLAPFCVLSFYSFTEVIGSAQGELVYFFSWVAYGGLCKEINTAGTSIFLFWTPTMSAAVRWNR